MMNKCSKGRTCGLNGAHSNDSDNSPTFAVKSQTIFSVRHHTYRRGGWPIQAVLWLEWGSSTAGRIPLRFAKAAGEHAPA
jgi:hypothetical protein